MPSIVGSSERIPAAPLAVATGPLFDAYPYPAGFAEVILWQLGDFRRTLLELTIDRQNGAIIGATLTAFDGTILDRAPTAFTDAPQTSGVPVVAVSEDTPRRIDEVTDLSMHLGTEYAYVTLCQDLGGAHCYVADRVGFLVAGGRLVGLAFGPLSPTEREAVRQILNGKG